MYRPAQYNGDSVAVPQLVFARLTFPDAGEARFRVALYLLQNGECDAARVADALRLSRAEVERELAYWEGAGLLERVDTPDGPALPAEKAPRRQYMTTAEVNTAAGADPVLGAMMQELQRIFGGMVGRRDQEIFCTLYTRDGFAADFILTAAVYCQSQGKTGALRVERALFDWQKQGIEDAHAADQHLKLLAARQARCAQVAALLGVAEAGLTLGERRAIAKWDEEYGYGDEMLELARLHAGDKQNDVKYLSSILKRWQGKGYRTTRDVQRAEEGRNLRVQGPAETPARGRDILSGRGYVPLSKRKGG